MRAEDQRTCEAIVADRDRLAEKIVARQYSLQSARSQPDDAVGRERRLANVKQCLDVLSQAIAAGRSALFVDYVAWAKVALRSRNVPIEDLMQNLEACYQTLADLPPECAAVAQQYVLDSVSCLPSLPEVTRSFIAAERPLGKLARDYLDALLRNECREASRLVMDAVQQNTTVPDIYLHVIQRSQYEVGRLWQINQITIEEEHACTAATLQIMIQLRPLFVGAKRKSRRMITVCAGGDLHEIGARMVVDFFEWDGWGTSYLGADAPTQSIVQAVATSQAHLLAISATLLKDFAAVTRLIVAVRNCHDCEGVRILVGGRPFNIAADLWRDVGADGFAPDALRAVALANQLVPDEQA